MASLRSVIQREIIAVKYALANNMAHEGVEGEDLEDVLRDLQAHKAEVIARSKSKAKGPPSPNSTPTPSCRREKPSDQNGDAQERKAKRTKLTRVQIPRPSAETPPVANAIPKTELDTTSAKCTEVIRPKPPASKETKSPKHDSKSSRVADLRQIRRDIKVGDVLSVLMDIRLPDRWVRAWVRGEVLQTMTRGGKFQIAFDHDKAGTPSEKDEKGEMGDDVKWIHEQRLEIDTRQYFCGKGNKPPRGIDSDRPKGSWYLHDNSASS